MNNLLKKIFDLFTEELVEKMIIEFKLFHYLIREKLVQELFILV
jgi:hypothetical protein